MATSDSELRKELVGLLRGGSAHTDLATALKNFPAKLYGVKPDRSPHSGWELLEHMRIALDDLLDFSTNSNYVELQWPDDYWPKTPAPPTEKAWHTSVRAIEKALKDFEKLVTDPNSNLFAGIPWGKDGQTLLHEVLLAADHNSYHIGAFVQLRRTLGAWPS